MTHTVSISIPCRNEAAYIEKCVRSIMKQSYNNSLIHVYVVDGMSDDGTREIVKKLTEEYARLNLIDNVLRITPVALNLGLKADNADIKIIFGAHAEMSETYVEECVRCLQDHPDAGCVGGIIYNTYDSETSEAIGLAMSSAFGVGNAHFRTGGADGYVDTVAFGAYRCEVFTRIGYFDEQLVRNQDDEFNYRLLKNGYKIFLSKKIISSYAVRASFSKLQRQYHQYGYWKVYVNRKHRMVTTWRQLVPFFFVLFLLCGVLVSPFSRWARLIFISGILVYFFAAAFFAFRKKASLMLSIMWSFFILHFSYGWGYLAGIIQLILLQKMPAKSSEKLSR